MEHCQLPPMSTQAQDSVYFPVSPPKTGKSLSPEHARPVLPPVQDASHGWTRLSDSHRDLPLPQREYFAPRGFRLPSFSAPGEDQLSPPFSDSRSSCSERDRSPDMPGGAFAKESRIAFDDRYRPRRDEGSAPHFGRQASSSSHYLGGNSMTARADVTASSSAGAEPSANRRQRVLMEPKQTAALLDLWNKTYFPSTAERDQLAKAVGLAPRQVQVWFQNQRQKQRRVLHDPSASQEERARLAELRHSPRTRRRLALAAQRDPNMSDEEYGLSPMSTDPRELARYPSDSVRGPAVRSYSQGRGALDIEMGPSWGPSYHSHRSASDYMAAFPSKEYVPPKAIIARTARSTARYQDEAPVARPHLWSDVPGRFEDMAAYRRHSLADHMHPTPSHFRRTSVSGWKSEQSPPRVLHSAGSLLPPSSSDATLKRKREGDDEVDVSRPATSRPYVSPPRDDSSDARRLPSLSALCLPPIRSPVSTLPLLNTPSALKETAEASARRVPSFAMLLHPA